VGDQGHVWHALAQQGGSGPPFLKTFSLLALPTVFFLNQRIVIQKGYLFEGLGAVCVYALLVSKCFAAWFTTYARPFLLPLNYMLI
jgi:hypothetical protein